MNENAHPAPSRARRRRVRRVITASVGGVLALVVAAFAGDALAISSRIQHFDVHLHPSAHGETWALVGSDARSSTVDGVLGTPLEIPGARADMVLLVHMDGDRSTTVSVPRDLLVTPGTGHFSRLALTYLAGPQQFLDGLCHTLGVTVDHLVVIDMASFAGLVDALGGVTITVDTPLRDRYSALDIPTAGRVHLDGVQALALVRSRHPERLVGGTWVEEDEISGARSRADWGAQVFGVISHEARAAKSNPIEANRIAWAASSGLTTDRATNVLTLLGATFSSSSTVDLPVAPLGDALADRPTTETFTALAAAGMPRDCN